VVLELEYPSQNVSRLNLHCYGLGLTLIIQIFVSKHLIMLALDFHIWIGLIKVRDLQFVLILRKQFLTRHHYTNRTAFILKTYAPVNGFST